jgi:glucose/mannose transport system permease protein
MFETTFRGNRFAEGAAIAIVMLVMVAVVVIPYLAWSTRAEREA